MSALLGGLRPTAVEWLDWGQLALQGRDPGPSPGPESRWSRRMWGGRSWGWAAGLQCSSWKLFGTVLGEWGAGDPLCTAPAQGWAGFLPSDPLPRSGTPFLPPAPHLPLGRSLSPPSLRIRGVRAGGPQAAQVWPAGRDLWAWPAWEGVTSGLPSCSSTFPRPPRDRWARHGGWERREGGGRGGAGDSEGSKRGDQSVSARAPPNPAETSLSGGAAQPGPPRPASRNRPKDVHHPAQAAGELWDQAQGWSPWRGGRAWVLGSSWGCEPPGPFHTRHPFRSGGFPGPPWQRFWESFLGPVQLYYSAARETEAQTVPRPHHVSA